MLTRRRFMIGGLLTAGTLVLGGCAGSGTSTRGAVTVRDEHGRVTLVFNDRDRDEIHRWYRRNLPPGLAKRETLPPGLRKQLHRKGTLPPGLETRRLDRELEMRLSPLPRGYSRLRIGTDIVLVDDRTRVILDVITDIGR
ncbi:MAG: hypothetical protein WCY26_12285 [Thiohalobacteraceae bacterium]